MIIKDSVELKTEMEKFKDETKKKADEDLREFYDDMDDCREKDLHMECKD